MLVSIASDKQHTPTSYRRLTPQRHLNESPAPTGPAARSALDQRSSALGSTAVSARAQSHLTCSGAQNVRINTAGRLLQAAADGRLVPDLVPRPTSDSWGKVNLNAKPLFRAGFQTSG